MKKAGIKVSWRLIWYCTLVWLLTFIVGSLVVLPWYYLILPLLVLLITVYYFDKADQVRLVISRKVRKNSDSIFALGLAVSIFWFVMIFMMSILWIVGFYYFDFLYYLTDPRIWLLYPTVLLMPVLYSLLLQNNLAKKQHRTRR